MLLLTRTIRFSINDGVGSEADWGAPTNTFAAYPTMRGFGRHYELDVRCVGEANPSTGYFLNIKDIDQATRATLIPNIERACREEPAVFPGEVLARGMASLEAALVKGASGSARLLGVRLRLSPYYSVEVLMLPGSSQAATPVAILRQQFEFAASHRLHCAELSDEQNREMFGKCNNPSGHGHNYRVEPAVEVPVGAAAAGKKGFSLTDLERVTAETVVKRFDHMHLNVDTAEFRTGPGGSGLNPSVENIAKVCYELLAPAIRQVNPDVRLRCVTVWETEKTSCTYPGSEA